MDFHQDWHGPWLITASFIAGALNAMAGGGSLLSFPALLSVGVPPIGANVTNTVALWPGQFTSIAGYLPDLKKNLGLVLPVCSAAFFGGICGAAVLLHTGQSTFMAMVPWLLLFATSLFAVSGPLSRYLLRAAARNPARKPARAGLWLGVTAVSFYIGYFGAGGGLLLMAILAVFGIEQISQMNALKVVATTTANGIAVVAFIIGRQVLWRYCVLMMVTAALGGFLGAHVSRRLNPRFLRWFVVVIGLSVTAYFFWKA